MTSYLDKIWSYSLEDFAKFLPKGKMTSSIAQNRILAVEKFLPFFNEIDSFIVSSSSFNSKAHINDLFQLFIQLQLKFNLKQIWSFEKRRLRNIIKYNKKYDVSGNLHYDKTTVAIIFYENFLLTAKAHKYVSNYSFPEVFEACSTLQEGLLQMNLIVSIPLQLERHSLNPFELSCLAGPEMFYAFKISNVKILLMGERHLGYVSQNIDKTYEVHKWLYDLVNNLTDQTDLLLEIRHVCYECLKLSDPIYEYNKDLLQALCEIEHMFSGYTSFENFQMHLADLRDLSDIRNPLIDAFNNRDKSSGPVNIKNYNHKAIIHYFIGYKKDERTRNIFYKFMNLMFGNNELTRYMDRCSEITNALMESIVGFDRERFYRCYCKAISKLFHRDSIIDTLFMSQMDIFCILKQLKLMETSKNIIIYAGMDHISIYNDFLKYYFNVNPIIEIKSEISQHIVFNEPFNFLTY